MLSFLKFFKSSDTSLKVSTFAETFKICADFRKTCKILSKFCMVFGKFSKFFAKLERFLDWGGFPTLQQLFVLDKILTSQVTCRRNLTFFILFLNFCDRYCLRQGDREARFEIGGVTGGHFRLNGVI